MKKFICFFIFAILSTGLFAHTYHVMQSRGVGNQKIYLTKDYYDEKSAAFAVFIMEGNKLAYVATFNSREDNTLAKEKALYFYRMPGTFLDENKNNFSDIALSYTTLKFDSLGEISIKDGTITKAYINFD